MKKYTVQGILIFVLGLGLGCFLNLDKLAPWYMQTTATSEAPFDRVFAAADSLRDASGVSTAVDAFDCSFAFLFNEMYKDNTKCLDLELESSTPGVHFSEDPRLRLAAMPREERRALAFSLYRRIQELHAVAAATTFDIAPVHGPQLAVTSTGSANTQVTLGLDAQTEPREEPPSKLPLRSVLVLGDSLALGLAASFERTLKEYNEQIDFARVGKVSSGLAIPHLFDWEKKVQVLIDNHKPDIIVVLMGINDANNNIYIDNRKAVLGTAAWPDAYQKRVERFLDTITSNNVPAYWVSLPVVRDKAMTDRIRIANTAAKNACTSFDLCHFVDIAAILTDEDGNYTNFKKDERGYSIRIRAQDGIHFSTDGGNLLSRYILDYISNFVELRPNASKEKPI
jgi:uncharacterized protein